MYPKQAAFLRSDALYRGFVGGRGTGKSKIGAYDLIKRAKPGRLYGLYAPTYPMLRDAALRSFLDMARELRYLKSYNRSDGIVTLGNGAEVLCRSLDDPEHARGPNLSGAWIDEASLTKREAYDIVVACLRQCGEQGWLSATFTPKGVHHWTYDVFGTGKPHTFLIRAKTRENPFLPKGFAATLASQYSGQFAKQELDGEFVAFEGLVYDEFSHDTHVVHRAQYAARYVVGVDEGYTNPAVALVIGLDNDERAIVAGEFYQRRVLQASFVDALVRINQKHRPDGFYVDPSAAGLIAEMETLSLPVFRANNDISQGIQAIKSRLAIQSDGLPRLTVGPDCTETISEFEAYVWARDKRDEPLDKPLKENDHAMDALRYGLLGATVVRDSFSVLEY